MVVTATWLERPTSSISSRNARNTSWAPRSRLASSTDTSTIDRSTFIIHLATRSSLPSEHNDTMHIAADHASLILRQDFRHALRCDIAVHIVIHQEDRPDAAHAQATCHKQRPLGVLAGLPGSQAQLVLERLDHLFAAFHMARR